MPISGFTDLKRAEVWWRPLLFWAGVSVALLLVFGIAFARAKSVGGRMSAGAVKLRDVATWTAADGFVFRERADGVLERVFGQTSAPETAEVSFLLGEQAEMGPARAGALIMSQKDKDDAEEEAAEGEAASADEVERARQQDAARLQRLSELGYADGRGPSGELAGVAVGSYDQESARALIERLRASGRESSVEEVTDSATGEKRYRVNAGAAADENAAARMSGELAREGIGGGRAEPGASTPTGAGTPPSTPTAPTAPPTPPAESTTAPAPASPPATSPATQARPVGDL